MKYFSLLLFAFIVSSCVTDTDPKKDGPKKGMDLTPAIREVKVESRFPSREDWIVLNEYTIPGVDPTGIAFSNPNLIVVSDTSQRKIYSILNDSLGSGEVNVLRSNLRSAYINHRMGKLILPEYDEDSIWVYRGGPELYKFHLAEELKNPSSFDGFSINNFTIVDQGNNRLFIKKGAEHNLIGKYGTGDGEFDRPSVVHVANSRQYIVDSGNKRIQILNPDGSFISAFGMEQNLINPSGLTSRGASIYVCDASTGYIYMYDTGGNFIYKFRTGIESPSDIYFYKEKLFVADKQGATVKVLTNKFYNDLEST